jgi:enamine deaminase RidA (YjgF/YER057c/UK114 family)
MTHGAAAVRAGDLLALSGMMAVDAAGPIAALKVGDRLGGTFAVGARAQMDYVVRGIETVCSAAGTSIENVTRVLQFHTDLGDFYPMHRAWQEALAGGPVPFAAVKVRPPLPVPACSVMVDCWVYAP